MSDERAKPIIFISHITEEAELAAIFRKEIEQAFLGMVEIFVSSDPVTITLGKNWLNAITDALRNCHAMLVFCSPYSVERPWINFECGAAWARGIDLAPLCHSGMRPSALPLPLNLLQGVEASDPSKIDQIFRMIAGKLNSAIPSIDAHGIATRVRGFEERHTEHVEIGRHLDALKKVSSKLFAVIAQIPANQPAPITGVSEQVVNAARPALEALRARGLLHFNFGVEGLAFSPTGGGNFGTLTLTLNNKLVEAIKSRLI